MVTNNGTNPFGLIDSNIHRFFKAIPFGKQVDVHQEAILIMKMIKFLAPNSVWRRWIEMSHFVALDTESAISANLFKPNDISLNRTTVLFNR